MVVAWRRAQSLGVVQTTNAGKADRPGRWCQQAVLLGNVPLPLRHCVRDGVADQVKTMRDRGGETLRCCFPMGQGGVTPFQRLRFIRHLDDFPDMLVSAEHGNAFNRRFHARHMAGGDFRSGQPADVASVFTQAGLVDPQGWIGVFAVALFVWRIDRERLGDVPVPRRWADLAGEAFAADIVLTQLSGGQTSSQFDRPAPGTAARCRLYRHGHANGGGSLGVCRRVAVRMADVRPHLA